jgi:toxin ParE1/3/4
MSHRVAPEAEADLDDIWCYIARKSGSLEIADRFTEFLSDRFTEFLSDRFYLLANHPYIGRRRDEELRPGLRSFPVRDYVIFYRIEDEDVLILRVLRGSRDIKALLGRE